MDTETGQRLYQEADACFQSGDYAGALERLRQLDEMFPEKRHILYAMARSLAALRRYDEALEVNQRVIDLFDYGPAKEIHPKLQQKSMDALKVNLESGIKLPENVLHTPSPGGLPELDISLTPSPRAVPPPIARQSGSDWKPYALWIALPFIAFFISVGLATTVGKPAIEWYVNVGENVEAINADTDNVPPFPLGAIAAVGAGNLLLGYILACWCGYWALRIVRALPFEDFGDDMKDVALYALFCHLLFLVPILGWIAALYMLNRHYELGFGRLLGTVVLFFSFGIGLGIATGIPYEMIVYGAVSSP